MKTDMLEMSWSVVRGWVGRLLVVVVASGVSSQCLRAGESAWDGPILAEAIEEESGVDWLTGEGVSLGGILFPSVHFRGAHGWSDGDSDALRVSAHDPRKEAITVQGLELGMSLRAWDHVEGFVSYHAYLDEDDNVEGEWEEIFGKLVDLPGGFELRGGQYLVRFGRHNAQHMHAWNFVDQYLAPGTFLGDHGLYMRGGEVTWNMPTPFTSALILGAGVGLAHEHDHGHGGEGGHDGHDHEEAVFESEDALFSDDDMFLTGRYLARFPITDFHQVTAGASFAYGENLFGGDTGIYGLDVEYLWRQNGLEPGGDYVRVGAELLHRDIEARAGAHGHDDHDDHGDHHGHDGEHHDGEHHEEEGPGRGDYDEWGLYVDAAYGFLEQFEAGVRFGYVEGIGDLGLDRRHRASAALTWWPTKERNFFTRVQYNHDNSDDYGQVNSLWVQVGFDWGSPEVR